MNVTTERVSALSAVDHVRSQRSEDLGPKKPQKGPAPLPGFTVRDLFDELKPVPYVCKTILDHGDILVVFGDSGTMKTFVVIDLLMHIGTHRAYYGHRVNGTGVLLIAGEGGLGMKRRIKAWTIRQGIGEHDPQPKIFVATQAADLMYDAGTIRATIEHAEATLGVRVGVVCFDTLAASFGSGDENATADVSKVIATARQTCAGRAIIFVHHVGHGAKVRERGAYVLRAAADRRIIIERPNEGPVITVKNLKAKDGEPFEPMSFAWRVVDTGWCDADGDPVTSIVLDPIDYHTKPNEPTGKVQKTVMEKLRKGPTTRTDMVRIITDENGFNRTAIYNAFAALIEAGLIDVGMDKKLRIVEVRE